MTYAVNGGPVAFWQRPAANNSAGVPLNFTNADSAGPPYDANNQKAAAHLGLLYPGSLNQNTPWDIRRSLSRVPDGTSTTIMLGENIKTGYVPSYPGPTDPSLASFGIGSAAAPHRGAPGAGQLEGMWANPHPLFAAFHMSDDFCDPTGKCDIGDEATVMNGEQVTVRRARWRFANSLDARDNPQRQPEGINGALYADEGWSYLSSLHPAGVVIGMCDGSARFLSSDIDGEIFAKLISPGGQRGMKESWPVQQSELREGDF